MIMHAIMETTLWWIGSCRFSPPWKHTYQQSAHMSPSRQRDAKPVGDDPDAPNRWFHKMSKLAHAFRQMRSFIQRNAGSAQGVSDTLEVWNERLDSQSRCLDLLNGQPDCRLSLDLHLEGQARAP